TVEILSRFAPLSTAVAVDVIPCPSMAAYKQIRPQITFACMNTQSIDFKELASRCRPVDLVFIDSHHQESQCRYELECIRDATRMIAFHDISNVACPGVARVWADLKATGAYQCFEYTGQYDSRGPFMGIGLAIRRNEIA